MLFWPDAPMLLLDLNTETSIVPKNTTPTGGMKGQSEKEMIERNAPATTVLAQCTPSVNMAATEIHMAGGPGHAIDRNL
jgi:hypothetical protein